MFYKFFFIWKPAGKLRETFRRLSMSFALFSKFVPSGFPSTQLNPRPELVQVENCCLVGWQIRTIQHFSESLIRLLRSKLFLFSLSVGTTKRHFPGKIFQIAFLCYEDFFGAAKSNILKRVSQEKGSSFCSKNHLFWRLNFRRAENWPTENCSTIFL